MRPTRLTLTFITTVALSLCALCVTLGASALAQGISNYMPYQGFLSDSAGQPITGIVNIEFKLYEGELDADSVWSDTIQVQVRNGSFSVYLGSEDNSIKDYLTSGRAHYLSISVDGQPALSPRQRLGSLPYAFLSYNASRLDGHPASDFVTQADIVNIGAGLSADDVNQLIDARGYLDTAAITALVNTLIDARNYLTADVIDARIANAVDVVNQRINTLQNQVDDLEILVNNNTTTLGNLQIQIDNIQNNAATSSEILGLSDQAQTGKFIFGGFNGLQAAHEMCQSSYAAVSTAHLCSNGEVMRAVSRGAFPNAISGVDTWAAMSVDFTRAGGSHFNNCQSFMYSSGDVADGTVLRVEADTLSSGGGGGVTGHLVNLLPNQGWGTSRRILCCR